jgi:hypothetical protein
MPRRIQVRLERRTQSEKPPGKTCWQGFNWRSSVDENDVINPRHLIDRAGNIGRAELIDAAKFASGPSATVQAIHSTARIRTFRGGKCQSVFENRQTVLLPGRMGHGTRKLIKNLSRSVPFPTTYKIAGRITDVGFSTRTGPKAYEPNHGCQRGYRPSGLCRRGPSSVTIGVQSSVKEQHWARSCDLVHTCLSR